MTANITIQGTRAYGFRVTVWLPKGFLAKFDREAACPVLYENLDSTWGRPEGEGRVRDTHTMKKAKAFALVEQIERELAYAKQATEEAVAHYAFVPLS